MVTYTTANKVANRLGFPDGYFTTSTTPTQAQIESLIEEAEDDVDFSTGHSWRATTVIEEYLNPISTYQYGTGIAFNLQNRSIRSIEKLQVWDGSTWEDWVITRTEGRSNDYWIDETNGVLYLVTLRSVFEQGVKIDYTYGESTVPKDIEKVTILMAAIEILNSPEFSVVLFTEASQNNARNESKLEKWQRTVDNILFKHSEFKVI